MASGPLVMSDDGPLFVLAAIATQGECGHESVTLTVLVPDDGPYTLTVCQTCDETAPVLW